MGTVHGTGHAGPWLLEGEHAVDIVAMNLFAGDRVDDGGLDAKERQRGGSRLGWGDAGQGGNDVGARLRLPVRLRSC